MAGRGSTVGLNVASVNKKGVLKTPFFRIQNRTCGEVRGVRGEADADFIVF